jgi:hypothetical protein
LCIDLSSATGPVHANRILQVNVQGEICQFQLYAIAYFGAGHFVTRLISSQHHVWFHDGITSGASTVYQGLVNDCDLSVCGTRTPAVYLYALM